MIRVPFTFQPKKKPDYIIGIYLILISSFTYGFKSTISKIVFDEGGDPFSLLFLSSSLYCLLSYAWFKKKNIPYELSKKMRKPVIILGLLFTAFCTFYAASIIYIPVSISTLIFFSFPFLVGAHAHLIMKDPIPGKRGIAFLLAFIGLSLIFLSTVGSYHIETMGIILSATGAFLKAACIIYARRHQDNKTSSLVIVFYMCLSMAVITGLITFIRGFNLPQTAEGYEALSYAIVFFAIGIPTFYLSIRFMGPVRVAFFNFLEPLVSILSAYFLLAEKLSPSQALGAILMLIGLTLMPVRRGAYYFKTSKKVDKT